jgi:2-iminobutanoate/2-iminopropanoate deaminase
MSSLALGARLTLLRPAALARYSARSAAVSRAGAPSLPAPTTATPMLAVNRRSVTPFSHATEVDGWVFVTGQMPTWPDDDARPLPEGIEAQTRRVMDNLAIVLAGVGLDLSHVVSARAYLTAFEADYPQFNATYASYFTPGRLPARTCIGVTALARGARVEVDVLARRPS